MNSSPAIRLILQNGPEAGKSLMFQAGEVIVGKDPRCDFVVNQVGVSRMHFRLETTQSGWQLVDLRSTNGTVINGVVVGGSSSNSSPILLTSSSHVRVGEAKLEICLPNDDRTEIVQLDMHDIRAASERPADAKRATPASDKGTFIFSVSPAPPASLNGRPSNAGQPALAVNDLKLGVPAESDPCTTIDQPREAKLPRSFRDFKLLKSIGVGGMGQVFLATQTGRNESVAIKFLKPQEDNSDVNRARFLREMDIAASLQHPSIVQLIECGDEAGQLFIAMEYCNGGNLAELLKRSKQLTLRRAVRLMDRLLAGVELAHSTGIVHRDLKPQNIILHKDSAGKFKPKITDFGLAKSYLQAGESGMTTNGTVGGSWAYMPIEQLTNFRFVSPTCDVWSLAAIFYECLAGRLPREHKPEMNPIRAILHARITPLEKVVPNTPVQLVRFLQRCLDNDPSKRFADGGEMRKELRQLAPQLGIDL